FALLTVELQAEPRIYGKSVCDSPLVDGEEMGRGRAQVAVRNNRTALGQVDVGQGGLIATCTGSSSWQAKQKIGKGQEKECSVGGVGAVDEPIAEYLGSKT